MQKTSRLQLLDCSLRDGGYYTNWDFPIPFVKEYLKRMAGLPVDYLEIGYRSLPKPQYLGAFFYSPPHILDLLAEHSGKKLAIMLNAKDITSSDLELLLKPCIGKIALIRIAVSPVSIAEMPEVVGKLKRMGFEVALNLMYLSKWWQDSSFISILKSFDIKPDFLYLVDSYGGMQPFQIKEVFEKLKCKIDIELGFHAHNNLELALANTLMAISSGVRIVDSTITGMGRGAGNLKTELLLTILNTSNRLEVDYDKLSKVVSQFLPLKDEYQWGANLAYMVSGANSLPQQEVMAQISKRYYSLNSIVRAVENKSKGVKDNRSLKEFRPEEKITSAIIVGGGASGTDHVISILKFVKEQSSICVIHASSRNAAAYRELQAVQYHCLVGNEGHRLEKVYENLETSNKVVILPPFPRTMGTYIPPTLENSALQLSGGQFSRKFPESVTALAIETAQNLGVKSFYFVGYDGYSGQIKSSELELFQENEAIFELLESLDVKFCALTPTKYNKLPQESVYSYL